MLPAARQVAVLLSQPGKPLDIVTTATDAGLHLDLHGLDKADDVQV